MRASFRSIIVLLCVATLTAGCGKRDTETADTTAPASPADPPTIALMPESYTILAEAEEADDIVAPFCIGQDTQAPADEAKTASNGKFLEIPRKAGKGEAGGGKAVIRFQVDHPGEYILWARVYFLSGCENSFGIEIDGYRAPNISSGNYDTWHWLKVAAEQNPVRFDLSKGEHTLVILNTEDGVKIDQVLFTTETDPDRWYPAGIME